MIDLSSCYSADVLVQPLPLGNRGRVHVRTHARRACRYKLSVHLFKPKNKTLITSFQSWVTRNPAEFKAADHVCQSEGREGAFLPSRKPWSLRLLNRNDC